MEPLTIVVTLASGIFLGWWGHILASRRDTEARQSAEKIARDNRLRDYEVFLLAKEQIVEAANPADVHSLYFHPSGSLNAGLFRAEAAKVRRDFPPSIRAEFNRIDEALSRMSPQGLQADSTRTSRDKVADAIRAILKFTNDA